ncbi:MULTISPECIES: MFS transporter [Marinitoga]|jgi:oligogalacturonide transporter|uniref:MFS transporter n=1 Tax=Marinitoga aeolica TaxID=2809031 RepID=A0ABY8PSK7_9BACT|nr:MULTISPECIES: glycoside-pentoside-hexuronide (GPH):cation symporter [Marinitoga]MBM7558721.1 oligogalacturonide transporter [Marinitoga litoralis]WGS65624.1 MFS transporter [Marinitoga aeolica]
MKRRNIIAYGMGDIFGGGSFLVIGTLFLIFLTDVVGLRPSLAGLVLIIGKAWDAISDPIMGYISDNTRSKFGKRRLYFLLGIFPIALSFYLLWLPINSNSQLSLFLFYSFAYILFSTVYTMVMIPYTALNAEMTKDYSLRTKLSGTRMFFSQISALLSGVLPKIIIDSASNPSIGYRNMAIVFSILYSLPWIFVFLGTFEESTKDDNVQKNKFDLLSLLKNKPFKIHIGMYIMAYTAMDILMALFIYYLTYYIQKPNIFSICLGLILLTEILSLPLHVYIANKYGKGKDYTLGLSIWAIGMFILFIIGKNTPTIFIYLDSIIIGFGLSAGVMIPWAMLPTIIDIDELITTKNRAGIYSGAMTFIRKIIQAVTLFVLGVFLDFIGYIPNQDQTASTLFKLKSIFVFLPILLLITGILLSLKYKVNAQNHKIIREEIDRLRNNGKKEDVDSNVKKICESITGLSYEQLYNK